MKLISGAIYTNGKRYRKVVAVWDGYDNTVFYQRAYRMNNAWIFDPTKTCTINTFERWAVAQVEANKEHE